MALTIHQQPLYDLLPAGEKIIYTAKDLNAVTDFVKMKYIARVYVAHNESDLGSTSNLGANSLVATLKTNPNSSGVGIFDLSPILDNYVSPDFEGGAPSSTGSASNLQSTYKGTSYDTKSHIIHVIDNFTANQNAVKFVRVIINTEYATNLTEPVIETTNHKTAEVLCIFNGYLDHDDILNEVSGNFGYNLNFHNYIMNDTDGRFLTDAPVKQYIRLEDFATMGFFNNLQAGGFPSDFNTGQDSTNSIAKMRIQYYFNNATQGAAIDTPLSGKGALGGQAGIAQQGDSNLKLQYYGVGTANQKNAGHTIPTNWDYYTVQALDGDDNVVSKSYEFHKQEDSCQGFETIRLCWINKYGVWDYYNFTQKSIRTFSKDMVSFQSQEGTWNGDKYKIDGYKGGKKIFKSQATEMITINTDFITDDEAIWLEGLFLSNNVFMLKQNSVDFGNQGILRKHIEPVIMASEELERQTTANNGKKQYTLTLNKSKNRRTQRT